MYTTISKLKEGEKFKFTKESVTTYVRMGRNGLLIGYRNHITDFPDRPHHYAGVATKVFKVK